MELGPFLRERRLQQGHGTIGALAQFAKALGIKLSRESLRLFENERKVPNPSTRKMLCDLLRLNVYQKYELERLCAESHIRNRFELGPVTLLDQEAATQLSDQISGACKTILEDVLPIDEPASEEDISNIFRKVGELCMDILEPDIQKKSM